MYYTQACALRRKIGFRTIITVPTVIFPNSTVQITVSDRTRQCHRTVRLRPQFGHLAPISTQNKLYLFATMAYE